MKMEQSVLKRQHLNSRRQGITQKKAYKTQNMAKAWNQGFPHFFAYYNLIIYKYVNFWNFLLMLFCTFTNKCTIIS